MIYSQYENHAPDYFCITLYKIIRVYACLQRKSVLLLWTLIWPTKIYSFERRVHTKRRRIIITDGKLFMMHWPKLSPVPAAFLRASLALGVLWILISTSFFFFCFYCPTSPPHAYIKSFKLYTESTFWPSPWSFELQKGFQTFLMNKKKITMCTNLFSKAIEKKTRHIKTHIPGVHIKF